MLESEKDEEMREMLKEELSDAKTRFAGKSARPDEPSVLQYELSQKQRPYPRIALLLV